MTNSEFAILDTTINYVEEQTLTFKKQLENSITVFDYDTHMRIAMLYYVDMAGQPRVNLDDVFISISGAIDDTMLKYNF